MDAVTPTTRGLVQPEDQEAIRTALTAREAADAGLRDAVLAAVGRGASVRELAAFTGLSTNTISRWKRDAK